MHTFEELGLNDRLVSCRRKSLTGNHWKTAKAWDHHKMVAIDELDDPSRIGQIQFFSLKQIVGLMLVQAESLG
jgi:hypothetical protein